MRLRLQLRLRLVVVEERGELLDVDSGPVGELSHVAAVRRGSRRRLVRGRRRLLPLQAAYGFALLARHLR